MRSRSYCTALSFCLILGATGRADETVQVEGQVNLERFAAAMDGIGDLNGDAISEYIVGAPGGNNNSGGAYVHDGATHAELYAYSGEALGDRFGRAVAGLGDINQDGFLDWAVGAPTNDVNGDASGKVYLYSGEDGSLITTMNGPVSGCRFGHALAGLTDIDQDFAQDFAVGAPEGNFNGVASGAVFVYSGTDLSLIYSFPGQAAGDRLGWSVARINDLNGDYTNDLIVGAPRANVTTVAEANLLDAGKVYLLSGDPSPDGSPDGGPLLQVLNNQDHASAFAYFGWSVDRVSDADLKEAPDPHGGQHGDFLDEVLVGAPDGGVDGRGRAYLFLSDREFVFDGGNQYDPNGEPFVEPLAPWTLQGDENSGSFGYSVAGLANFRREPDIPEDGDGVGEEVFSEIAVGDPDAFNAALGGNGSEAGRVWVFDGHAFEAAEHLTGAGALGFLDGQRNGDHMGWAVSNCGHPSNYGMGRLLAGAPDVDFGSGSTGLANAGDLTVFTSSEASVIYYGAPCDASAGVWGEPTMSFTGNPRRGTGWTVRVHSNEPNAQYFFIISFRQAMYPTEMFSPGIECGLYVNPIGAIVIGPLSLDQTGGGAASCGLGRNLELFWQAVVINSRGEGLEDYWSLTNAIEMAVH